MTPREKFVSLIRNDILRLDLAELDFGIYRILNHRRRAVEQYLEKTLPDRIAASIAKLKGAAVNEEERIYAQLHTFFARYYEDGDFVMKARRGRNAAYSVPYNGEDVHFHWASKGSHYVKSGLMFEHYRIKLTHGERIVLAVDHAETPKDNNKSKDKRYFIPATHTLDTESGEHRFTFQWRVLTDAEKSKYAGKSKDKPAEGNGGGNGNDPAAAEGRDPQERILNAWLAASDFKSARAPAGAIDPDQMRPHAQRFVRKHEADFFVHPQLRAFLEGELDYFLKNEFIAIWDNDDASLKREREKFKIAREIGLSLIRFLSEIEDVQAALFEKRRFVTQTDYLVQASAVSATLRQTACANATQVAEWAQWLGEKVAKSAKVTAKLGESLLTRYPHLPIHTRHFDDAFTLALLAEFPDLDVRTSGILIYSENYGALRTLEPMYRGHIKCAHIDPPYNTATSGFLYKNQYQHSTWLSMLIERIHQASCLLQPSGNFLCHIDENEYERLHVALDRSPLDNAGTIAWDKRNPMTGGTGIATQHEYVIWRTAGETKLHLGEQNAQVILDAAAEIVAKHKGASIEAKQEFAAWMDANDSLSGGEKAYKYLDDRGRVYQSVSLRAPEPREDKKFHIPLVHPATGLPCPVPPNGFSRTPETLAEMMSPERDEILFGVDEKTQPRQKMVLKAETRRPVTSVIQNAQKGKGYLDALGLGFPYCHPVSLYETLAKASMETQADIRLDFFAGSGTTGHAVINLNREDGGSRKFMLVEMGEYFDTVLLPRIAKVMTSPEWKDGKPKEGVVQEALDDEHWSKRTLPVVKVLRLESYDDALNAIALDKDATGDDTSLLLGSDAGQTDEALIRYVLGGAREETNPQSVWLDTDALDKPFDYALPAMTNGVPSLLKVDLTETACLMLGLQPVRIRAVERAAEASTTSKAKAASAPQRFRLVEGWLTQEGNKLALLVLRDYVAPTSGDEAKAEYQWLNETVKTLFGHALADYAKVYYNRDMVFMGDEKFECVDGLLKRRMMERASA